ncbi:hypothetical protein E2C01_064939 [Portunus trituberculatus]|uniref:Uncharacterized protein n=1 Tax=Portunus trituberculatus TaxID=210409 RepID=A0A5B7HQE2_PORTR|nr:hypothetical protein [Portunus trituberculatus]
MPASNDCHYTHNTTGNTLHARHEALCNVGAVETKPGDQGVRAHRQLGVKGLHGGNTTLTAALRPSSSGGRTG